MSYTTNATETDAANPMVQHERTRGQRVHARPTVKAYDLFWAAQLVQKVAFGFFALIAFCFLAMLAELDKSHPTAWMCAGVFFVVGFCLFVMAQLMFIRGELAERD